MRIALFFGMKFAMFFDHSFEYILGDLFENHIFGLYTQ